MNLGLTFAPLVSAQILWAAIAVAAVLALLLFVSRSRGATMRAVGRPSSAALSASSASCSTARRSDENGRSSAASRRRAHR